MKALVQTHDLVPSSPHVAVIDYYSMTELQLTLVIAHLEKNGRRPKWWHPMMHGDWVDLLSRIILEMFLSSVIQVKVGDVVDLNIVTGGIQERLLIGARGH